MSEKKEAIIVKLEECEASTSSKVLAVFLTLFLGWIGTIICWIIQSCSHSKGLVKISVMINLVLLAIIGFIAVAVISSVIF